MSATPGGAGVIDSAHRPAMEVAADAWLGAMRRADFATAWRISDAVQRDRVAAGPRWDLPRHEQWVWDGRDLSDRVVLVRCYHGLGDTIMCARFLPLLTARARRVIVWAQPELLPLLRTQVDGADELLPLHDGTPEVAYDVDIESMELAHALRVDAATLPPPARFHVPPAPRFSTRPSIGLVARAGAWDPRRSVPLARLAAAVTATPARRDGESRGSPSDLAHRASAASGSADSPAQRAEHDRSRGLPDNGDTRSQPEPTRTDGESRGSASDSPNRASAASGAGRYALFSFGLDAEAVAGVRDIHTKDILELAARLQAMDLVVTVDTMLAHVSASLGVRTFILLPADADWRWLAHRSDSPWYPTARLFRQPRPGDWKSVLAEVTRTVPCVL